MYRPGFEPGNSRSQVMNLTTELNDKLQIINEKKSNKSFLKVKW